MWNHQMTGAPQFVLIVGALVNVVIIVVSRIIINGSNIINGVIGNTSGGNYIKKYWRNISAGQRVGLYNLFFLFEHLLLQVFAFFFRYILFYSTVFNINLNQ